MIFFFFLLIYFKKIKKIKINEAQDKNKMKCKIYLVDTLSLSLSLSQWNIIHKCFFFLQALMRLLFNILFQNLCVNTKILAFYLYKNRLKKQKKNLYIIKMSENKNILVPKPATNSSNSDLNCNTTAHKSNSGIKKFLKKKKFILLLGDLLEVLPIDDELSTEYDPHEHKSDLENGIPEAYGIRMKLFFIFAIFFFLFLYFLI